MKKHVFAHSGFTLFSLVLFLLNFAWIPTPTPAKYTAHANRESVRTSATIPFIENVGQAHENVRFYATINNGTAFIENDGSTTYSFQTKNHPGFVLKEKLVDSNPSMPEGQNPLQTKITSLIGNSSEWKTEIPNYEKVEVANIYDGISMTLKATKGSIEKIYTIAPGSNPSNIAMQIQGVEKLSIENNELIISSNDYRFTMSQPIAFQETKNGLDTIDVAYNLIDQNHYGFTVGKYDTNLPLIIDPVLASTFLGTANVEGSNETNLAIDSNGKLFIAAETTSASDFPTTSGAYDEDGIGGSNDLVVSRFSNDLTTLEASTYIGSTQADTLFGLAIDSSDNVYITGNTAAGDFPTTGEAYDTSFNLNSDVFVSKLSNDLTTLSASTFIGGSAFEVGLDVSIAPTSPEKVLITGRTQSSNFPTTGTPFDSTLGGTQDAFVSKFDIDLTTLEASTYLGGDTSTGGAESERGTAVESDAAGLIYVAGYTNENDLPVTGGAYDSTYNLADGFIGRFDSNLSSTAPILTYFGGTNRDTLLDMIITGNGIYVAGVTLSSDFPTTGGTYSNTLNSTTDGFLSRFSTDLSTLQTSTYVSANGSEAVRALATDSNDNIFVVGETDATTFPSSNCLDLSSSGFDAFVMNFSTDLTTLNSSGLLGGSSSELGKAIAIDGSDNIFIGGTTQSSNFATTSGAYDESHNGSVDMFITKYSDDLDTEGANQFCGTQVIASSTLTFQDIPDTFSFTTITAGSSQDLFNNETPPDANEPAADDLLQIFDDRNSGGFTVTIDPDGVFDDENGVETIPLSNLYIVTSLDETDAGNNAGLTYSGGFTGDNTVSMPIYVDVDSLSLTNTATYTSLAPASRFGGAPLTIMDGTLGSGSGRVGTMSTFMNFYLHIDPIQADGSYSLILTYTLADSTT